MLAQAAVASRPECAVALLPRAVWARRASSVVERAGIEVVRDEIDPWSVLGGLLLASATDEWAFLAIAAGGTVGLSERKWERLDGAEANDWLARELVVATAYRDPFTGRSADGLATVSRLASWRRRLDADRGIAVASGVSGWKRRTIARFLWTGRRRTLVFTGATTPALTRARRAGGGIAIWPSRAPEDLDARADAAGVPTWRIEDGFIRSVGLGVHLHQPWSVVVDRTGLYYDPGRPSDLETILETGDFGPDMLARAERLWRTIVDRRIGKYAVGDGRRWPASGRRRILVAGQVEDDRSVLLAGGGIAGNRGLLARARAIEPDADIWFRPHPDVEAGHRAGGVPDREVATYADRIMREGSMADLLDAVDGVHVLTSLTGFEALLRGRDVTVHGLPFYAGWGLTRDLTGPFPRRSRRLTLAELVAGTLILYPRYLDPATLLPCDPETLIARLADVSLPSLPWLARLRIVEGALRRRMAWSH